MSAPENPLPLAVTMGEPAGIGGELTLFAWLQSQNTGDFPNDFGTVPPFFAVDDPRRLETLAERINIDIPIETIDDPSEALQSWPRALPVLAQFLDDAVVPGRPNPKTAAAVTAAIEKAVQLTTGGHAAAVVTNPIHKQTLYDGGFTYSGHTDFLAALAKIHDPQALIEDPVMMLASPELRVVPITIHLSLADAIEALNQQAIVHCGRVVFRALTETFGIAEPRIAVAGLNPHAGENGALGHEEAEIIQPAIDELASENIVLKGPVAADTIFNDRSRRSIDAVLCMYHDQALIPIKTLDFWHTVNITLGLPFVRTSPGHGTALDLAGHGTANPASFIAALQQAALMTAGSN